MTLDLPRNTRHRKHPATDISSATHQAMFRGKELYDWSNFRISSSSGFVSPRSSFTFVASQFRIMSSLEELRIAVNRIPDPDYSQKSNWTSMIRAQWSNTVVADILTGMI